MKATYNGYVWALRSSPEFTKMDLTMRFTLPTRDFTIADYFELTLLYHNPATPSGGLCTSSGPTMCSYVTAQSGLSIAYRLGFGQLIVSAYANGVGTLLNQTSLPVITLNTPHEARAVYSDGSLKVYLDSAQLLGIQTPRIPAGQIGFNVYRMDMIANTLTLVGTPVQRLLMSLTGSFDYLLRENVHVQISAMVTDAATGLSVTGADVSIQIFDSSSNVVIPSTQMLEGPTDGVYLWTSSGTVGQLNLAKGVYLAQVTGSLHGGPSTNAILSFHIDPPVEDSAEPFFATFSIAAILGAVSAWAAAILAVRGRVRRSAL
jgi:hypothetical protein